MPRKPMLITRGEPLSPKRTADMIRQLRELTRDLRMLKTRLETEEKGKRQRTVLASRRRRRADWTGAYPVPLIRPVPDLTPDQLAALLAKLDAVMRQAQELSAQIKSRLADERWRNRTASDWSDRRKRPQPRQRRRSWSPRYRV